MPLKCIFDTIGPIAGRLGDMTQDEAVRLSIALCFAANNLSEHGHGNIWPGAVRIGAEGTVLLDPTQTNTPSADETEYAAPERFWNGTVSPAGDMYSIGLILYATLNHGRLPFIPETGKITANHRADALKQRMNGSPITFPASFDKQLCDILRRALAFKAEDRWETLMAMHDALCNCTADLTVNTLLPEDGVAMFGKAEANMSEVERMMSEILEQNAADITATVTSEICFTPEKHSDVEIPDVPETEIDDIDLPPDSPIGGISAKTLAMSTDLASSTDKNTDIPVYKSVAESSEAEEAISELEPTDSEVESEDVTGITEDVSALTDLSALAENSANAPLDEMMSKVDSHLDVLSSSLFTLSDSEIAAKETERRKRIAEAVDAHEEEQRKTRRHRFSIAAIVSMIFIALAAMIVLAHSFGFKGLSLTEIGDVFYNSVFSKIFDKDEDSDPDPISGSNKEDTKLPPASDDTPDNNTTEEGSDKPADHPDTAPDVDNNTALPDPNVSNPTQDTLSNVNNPANNNGNNSNNNTSNGNNNDSPAVSPIPGIIGTSGSGTPVTDSTPIKLTSTYTLTIDNCIWQDARDAAEDAGGHLLTISNEEEFQYVIAMAEEQGISYIWLGSYRKSGNWLWITGEEFTYAPWHNGKPSGSKAHYAVLCKVVENGTATWGYCNYTPDADFPEGKLAYIIEHD